MRRLLMLALALVACLGLSLPAAAVTNGTYDGSNHPYVAYEDNLAFACTGTLLSPTVMLTAAHCFSDSTSGLGTNDTTSASQVRVNFDPNLINTPAAQRMWYVGAYYCPMGDADPIAGGVTESPEKVTLMTTGSMELSVPLDASSPHAVSPTGARSNADAVMERSIREAFESDAEVRARSLQTPGRVLIRADIDAPGMQETDTGSRRWSPTRFTPSSCSSRCVDDGLRRSAAVSIGRYPFGPLQAAALVPRW